MVDDGDEKYSGTEKISDADLWNRLREGGFEQGIISFLKFRKVPYNAAYVPEGISFENFIEQLEKIEAEHNRKLEKDISVEQERIHIEIPGTEYFFEVEKCEYFYLVKENYSHCGALTFESAMKKLIDEIAYRFSLMKSMEKFEERKSEPDYFSQKNQKQSSYGYAVAVLVIYVAFLLYGILNEVYGAVAIISVIVIILSAVIVREKKRIKK